MKKFHKDCEFDNLILVNELNSSDNQIFPEVL
jgi:hypothetical protein